MSITALTAVLELAPAVVTPSERLVLVALAWHADHTGRNSWPAVATICRKTSLARRTVQVVLPRLKQKGLVYVQSIAARGSVRYAVDLVALDRARHAQSATVDRAPDAQSAAEIKAVDRAPDARGGCTTCTPTAHDVHGGGAPAAPDPSLNRPLIVPEEEPGARSAQRQGSSDQDRKEERRTYVVPSGPNRNGSAADAGAARRASAPPAAPTNPPPDDDDNPDDDAVIPTPELQRLADALFDELGDDTPIDVLEPAFVARAHIRDGDPLRDHLGAFLFNVRRGRRLIEKHFGPVRPWKAAGARSST